MCDGVAVLMEYIGNKKAGVTFLGKYVGADNEVDNYACVDPNDVGRLERSGQWRVAVPTTPALPEDGSDLTGDPDAVPTTPALPEDGSDLTGDPDAVPGEGLGTGVEGVTPAPPVDPKVKATLGRHRRKG